MSIYEQLKDKIKQNLIGAANSAKQAGELEFSELPNFTLEVPRERTHGDFATNLAMLLARQAKAAPRIVAEKLSKHFDCHETWVKDIEIAGPGFINFRLDTAWLAAVVGEVLSQGADYGSSNVGQGKKVQVEFVSANPTGLLHMGNARGAALGDSLANLLGLAGYEVSREFYINDAGNQIENFAKSLEARYLQQLGHDVPFPEEGYHGEDLIDTVNKLITQVKDKYVNTASELRKEMMVKYALQEKLNNIKETLSDFGVEYDVWFSEQSLHDSGQVQHVLEQLKEKGYIYEKEGALWLRSTDFGDEKDEVVVRSNGTPTYFAADIAYHKNKFERGFERVINIWGADHHGHVARMKGAIKALDYNPDNLEIILMQLVRLIRNGEIVKMSKRSGQYITLRELIDEVGRDAARFFFILRDPDSAVEFDMDLAKAESSDNPVYYVQYAHARLCSILRKGEEDVAAADCASLRENADYSLLLNSASERDLLRKIGELPAEIATAAMLSEPHRIARFALDLASLFHTFYNDQRVLADDLALRAARLNMVEATKITLYNILSVLGVNAPERM
ncbi:MAG TPA: arginine--tRNA ligase [Candidatus Deferrimicrobium sp.]|nr:arginine--tRNA ligase [Candidatus Deferrimicrobium sp.]